MVLYDVFLMCVCVLSGLCVICVCVCMMYVSYACMCFYALFTRCACLLLCCLNDFVFFECFHCVYVCVCGLSDCVCC